MKGITKEKGYKYSLFNKSLLLYKEDEDIKQYLSLLETSITTNYTNQLKFNAVYCSFYSADSRLFIP